MPMGCGYGIHDGGVRLPPWSGHLSAHSTGSKTDTRITAYPFDLPSIREGIDIQDAMLFSKPYWRLHWCPIPFETLQVKISLTHKGCEVVVMHGKVFMRTPLACGLVTLYQECGNCLCSIRLLETSMAERIDTKAFIHQLALKMRTEDKVAAAWLEATLETLYANFKAGKGVTLTGFGGFYVQPRGKTWAFKFNPGQKLRALFGWSSSYKGTL
jgi:DNA-binding protein HU-beta